MQYFIEKEKMYALLRNMCRNVYAGISNIQFAFHSAKAHVKICLLEKLHRKICILWDKYAEFV